MFCARMGQGSQMYKRLFIVAALTLVSCSQDGNPEAPVGGSSAAIGGSGDAGACARPEYGCPCSAEEEPVECYFEPVVSGAGWNVRSEHDRANLAAGVPASGSDLHPNDD